jgi:hypothetical protein
MFAFTNPQSDITCFPHDLRQLTKVLCGYIKASSINGFLSRYSAIIMLYSQ